MLPAPFLEAFIGGALAKCGGTSIMTSHAQWNMEGHFRAVTVIVQEKEGAFYFYKDNQCKRQELFVMEEHRSIGCHYSKYQLSKDTCSNI